MNRKPRCESKGCTDPADGRWCRRHTHVTRDGRKMRATDPIPITNPVVEQAWEIDDLTRRLTITRRSLVNGGDMLADAIVALRDGETDAADDILMRVAADMQRALDATNKD